MVVEHTHKSSLSCVPYLLCVKRDRLVFHPFVSEPARVAVSSPWLGLMTRQEEQRGVVDLSRKEGFFSFD